MSAMLKVVVNAIPLTAVNTGIGRYLRCLYTAIERDFGHEVRVGYFDGSRVLGSMPEPLADVAGRSRITSFLWNLPPAAALAARLAVQARRELAFYRAARGFDVYHEASFFPMTAPRGVKTVFTIHDLSLLRYPQHHPRERVMFFNLFFRRRLARVSRFLAVSEFTRGEMVKHLGLAPERIGLTHNAIDPDLFHPRPGASASLGLAPGQPYFLFLGTNDPRKNPQVIPKALARSGLDIPLVLAGWTGWGGESPAGARVIELGYVDDQALAGLYSDALALVYPSVYEGFGLPVLEAMACGCPVITSRSSSLPEVGGEACLYLEDPSDPDEMALALTALAGDPARRQAMRQAGLLRAKAFSWAVGAANAVTSFRTACS